MVDITAYGHRVTLAVLRLVHHKPADDAVGPHRGERPLAHRKIPLGIPQLAVERKGDSP